jgi:hypothetical protein
MWRRAIDLQWINVIAVAPRAADLGSNGSRVARRPTALSATLAHSSRNTIVTAKF